MFGHHVYIRALKGPCRSLSFLVQLLPLHHCAFASQIADDLRGRHVSTKHSILGHTTACAVARLTSFLGGGQRQPDGFVCLVLGSGGKRKEGWEVSLVDWCLREFSRFHIFWVDQRAKGGGWKGLVGTIGP
ncbi:hypothetical protein B0T25DRAFT_249500 [Lasiosphaeria hispida]|uniref:Secreted protein n=1 Tax=Lasiosphaeria hispida TaxID=260671 RepID=A0AAJ0HFB8_9PEZI|nr:hypothetical protein B0T25DRAFT_249500 [Lasiosphaeria hispida]